MKLRRAAFLGLLSGLLLSASKPPPPVHCQRVALPSLQWDRCDRDSLWIVETSRPLSVHFAATGVPTLRQWAERLPQAVLLVNGSYHDGDYARPTMVGLLEIEGQRISPPQPDDRQLSRIIRLDRNGALVALSSVGQEQRPERGTLVQTGPAILDGGKVTTTEIMASANGRDSYKRTAIGRTAQGATVIVIARTPRRLTELAAMLQRINDYGERGLTLVNLDGGPSTSIHAPGDRRLSYGADKVTPIIVAVQR